MSTATPSARRSRSDDVLRSRGGLPDDVVASGTPVDHTHQRPESTDLRVLIVDDEQPVVDVLKDLLRAAGYETCRSTTDPRQAVSQFLTFKPDLVLLDLNMPGLDGLSVLRQLEPRIPKSTYLPILVLTGDASSQARVEALGLGAKDFVRKPFDMMELRLRIENLLTTRALHLKVEADRRLLERRVRTRTRELELAHLEACDRLALAAEYRNAWSVEHPQRVGVLAGCVARSMGFSDERATLVEHAAPLHDVGKLAIPDEILLKPGPLTQAEYATVQSHVTVGARILSGRSSSVLRMAQEIALTHHERWDGAGYPRGLAGEAIPLEGRIVAVVDAFDAMTNHRPYRDAMSTGQALCEIHRERGRQFDPAVVEVFTHAIHDTSPRPDEPDGTSSPSMARCRRHPQRR